MSARTVASSPTVRKRLTVEISPRARLERASEFVTSAYENLSDYWLAIGSVRRNLEAYERAPIADADLTGEERFQLEEVKSFLMHHGQARRRPRKRAQNEA